MAINRTYDNRDNNHVVGTIWGVLMVRKDRDIITWVVVIGIIVYILWYISTHSPEVTLGEVLTIWGGTLLMFSWLLDRATKNIEKYVDLKFDALKEKLDNLKSKRRK